MSEPCCPVCEEELLEVNPGFESLHLCAADNQMDDSFIGREFSCTNKKCKLFKKRIDVFWDFTRYEIDGEETKF